MDTPTSHALVLLIKHIATSKGMTQHQISAASGIAQPNVAAIFAGRRVPSLPTFLKLCTAVELRIFFEAKDSGTDLMQLFQRAMDEAGLIDPSKN